MPWRPITVLGGKAVRSNARTRTAASAKSTSASPRGRKGRARLPISPRETEVLRHIADGVSTEDVAKKLALSEKTVRTHVQNLLRKLKMHSRVEAVVWAYRNGVARA